ncbi:MAG: DNA polymerase III subunit delta, partial [Erysipelotrichaceae bacterium]|nr:DNA polymerase III subunit delta [Erysipelotrichaceae bacterium]
MIRDDLQKFQPVVYQVLNNALKNNRLSHCYLFTGPRGTLKLEAAYLLAQSLVCEQPEDGWACEECGSCRRV